MRQIFHEELRDLKGEVLIIGHLVEQSIERAVEALVTNDLALADEVITGDDEIDKRALGAEEQCMSVVATQSPVARDLRLIFSLLFISIHLERMGDLAQNIAEMTKRLTKEDSQPELLALISEMGRQVQGIVHTGLKAFAEKDLELARVLPRLDEPIDALFKRFLKELAKVSDIEHYFEWASNMVLASRYLERIADHAVDIGERVSYLVTGRLEEN
ncbi:MAG TPA: phosphate signaling complex protein PhoU [Actinobacteria bacterium]|nr:phosphate signaling complex protein PhoU [Actinomycetota bacterium]